MKGQVGSKTKKENESPLEREEASTLNGKEPSTMDQKGASPMKKVLIWLFIALVIGGLLSHFASSHPDGFEKAGEEAGFIQGATALLASPFPDYTIPGLPSWVSTGLSGILGVMITFGVFLLLSRILLRKSR